MEKLNLNRSFSVLFKTVFLAALTTIYLSILFSYPEKSDIGVIMTNFVVVAYSTYRSFFNLRYNYSIYQFFYIFSLFFMGMAPLVQYKQSVETVGGYSISDNTYILTNTILITIFILIDLIYRYRNGRSSSRTQTIKALATAKDCVRDSALLKLVILALSLISLGYAIYINQYDLSGLFYRDIFIDRVAIEDSTIRILAGIIRPLSIFTFIFYFQFGKSRAFKMLLLSLAIVTCFPAALPRFLAGACWIPVALTIFHSLSTKRILGYIYAASLLILFPAFEIFRAMSNYTDRESIVNEFFKRVSEAFSSMSYDSFQSFAFVVQNNVVTFGNQLLGVLGLFIPRSIWGNKPIGSGFTISNQFNLGFDNISMNFFGEGYINFGIIGVFLFAVALAATMRYLDCRYWSLKNKASPHLFSVIYMIILGIFAYIMRGDMIGSFTSTIAVIISASIVYCIIVNTNRIRFYKTPMLDKKNFNGEIK